MYQQLRAMINIIQKAIQINYLELKEQNENYKIKMKNIKQSVYYNYKIIKIEQMQKMRHHQRYLSKLQKISETSSPSKQQQSPVQTTSLKSRINPSSLTTSYLKFKRFEQQRQISSLYLQQSMKAQCQANTQNDKLQLQPARKVQTIDQKNSKIAELQQKIVNKKMQLTLLEDCFQKRSAGWKKGNFTQIFTKLFHDTLKVCTNNKEGRKVYLDMVVKYGKQRKTDPLNAFKSLIQWTLKIVKQIFGMLGRLVKFQN